MSLARAGSPDERGRVVELGDVEWRLPVHGAVLGLARQYARVACGSWHDREACDAVLLIVSELLGNAVKAAVGSRIRLRLAWTARRVRIEVADDGDTMPVMRQAGPSEEGGRGLWLVGTLAVRWGSFRQGQGKCVWAEVALPAA